MIFTAPQIKEPKTTHLVAPNEAGQVVAVMCFRVKPRRIEPDHALWSSDQPSCPVCATKWADAKGGLK